MEFGNGVTETVTGIQFTEKLWRLMRKNRAERESEGQSLKLVRRETGYGHWWVVI